jgi:hypothetical protein
MKNLNSLIKQVLREEHESSRYMFFSNLEQMKRQCEILLDMDHIRIEDHFRSWSRLGSRPYIRSQKQYGPSF